MEKEGEGKMTELDHQQHGPYDFDIRRGSPDRASRDRNAGGEADPGGIRTPETVLDQALIYIRIYFVGIPFMVAYNFGSAIVRSYGDTRRPMYYLIVSGVLNVILNLMLVIGFHMGVEGVAIATLISNMVSAFLILSPSVQQG